MTAHDLTILNTEGDHAVVVTITPLNGAEGADYLADAAANSVRDNMPDGRVIEQ